MDPELKRINTHAGEANRHAACAHWWIKNIDRDEAKSLGILDKINSILSILQRVDNLTMDIMIIIKNKAL